MNNGKIVSSISRQTLGWAPFHEAEIWYSDQNLNSLNKIVHSEKHVEWVDYTYQPRILIEETLNQNIVMAAYNSITNITDLLQFDTLGNVHNNPIQGNIFQDNNNDCTNNTGDINLSGIIVEAINIGGDSFYATTDSFGNYSMLVDSGSYSIRIKNDLPYYLSLCQANPGTIVFNGFYQLVQVLDFPLSSSTQCPLMNIDVSAPFIRSTGQGSDYTISYCNNGTVDAQNVYTEIEFDPDLTILTSSIPISAQVGNLYTFNLGNVGVGDCGSFSVQVIAGPTALIDQSFCTEAHIYPDSICIPNFWNGANMDINAACVNDTVVFTIQNKGASMLQPLQYFVYEDDIIFKTGSTSVLGANGTEQIKEYALAGKTYRLDIKQISGFPALLGDSVATAVIEGCNPYTNGTFNTGFVTNLSNGNSSPFIAIDCQPMIAAYDPNDKTAQPEGYAPPHYIYNYTPLDYKVRFQNTGTDTAFRVVIRDTLSAHLDIASIQMGASSHNYTWRVYGTGILEITFDNIMLPDSNVNEPGSNGFVRFRINQVPNNVAGTVIYNDAAIYFDYNAPIITNETYHTIRSGFVTMVITGLNDIDDSEDVEVKVYPNPFKEQATLEVVGADHQELILKVYDITGREAIQYISTNNKIEIQRNNLPQGVYIFQLEGDGELIKTGKLIVD
ncbi:MAG: T9SS type A sorting domain-containing protein [Aureispira sp.]|nr:T9SS type A sorting domain-containing protein [Aureispira sp.]